MRQMYNQPVVPIVFCFVFFLFMSARHETSKSKILGMSLLEKTIISGRLLLTDVIVWIPKSYKVLAHSPPPPLPLLHYFIVAFWRWLKRVIENSEVFFQKDKKNCNTIPIEPKTSWNLVHLMEISCQGSVLIIKLFFSFDCHIYSC